jgi:hypothetical protein
MRADVVIPSGGEKDLTSEYWGSWMALREFGPDGRGSVGTLILMSV